MLTQVVTIDAQPAIAGSIVVCVTGRLLVDNETNPMQFSQTFQLVPNGGGEMGGYHVFNDVFRLNYGY